MKSIKVDGNDFEAIDQVTRETMDWVRTNKKPAFIESMTYKLSGQYEGDTETYKSQEEVEYWKTQDPLIRYKNKILSLDSSVETDFVAIENENREKVLDAFRRAERDPFPTVEDLHDAVYVKEGLLA